MRWADTTGFVRPRQTASESPRRAAWCPSRCWTHHHAHLPCKSLGPVLEKVEAAYAGRFKLVKINSDDEQQLAGRLRHPQHPDLRADGGRPAGRRLHGRAARRPGQGLPGQAPAAGRRAGGRSPSAEADRSWPRGDDAQGLARQDGRALAKDPANNDVRFDYVKQLIARASSSRPRPRWRPALAQIPAAAALRGLAHWLNALLFVANDPRGHWPWSSSTSHRAEQARLRHPLGQEPVC
jgi:putative thioredoxin